MHTVIQHGDEHESATAQTILSNSQYCEQISMDVNETEVPTIASDSARRLQYLQNSNYHLTSGPTLPKLSNEDIIMENSQNSSGMIFHPHSHLHYLPCHSAKAATTSSHVKKRTLPEHITSRKKQRTTCTQPP